MRENFLHHVWLHKKFDVLHLKTSQQEPITLISVGTHNQNAGPDFLNAKLKIAGQLWAGNVEIHVKSSDWFAHEHEQDAAYDSVILHVVYEHDTEIFRKNNSTIPTLELKHYIHQEILQNYQKLFSNKKKWINCETDFAQTDDFIIRHWLERLYFERLERKSKIISELLVASKNDWEAVLFKMLGKNFGLKVNGESFFSIAKSLDFSVIRKSQSNLLSMEALFFGQAGLLDENLEIMYFQQLKKEYDFLAQKYQLSNRYVLPLQFFRLRPPNFPTIRLSQLAVLYHKQPNLFSLILACNSLDDVYKLFEVSTSSFWTTHYTFQNKSKSSEKKLTKSFIDLLLMNTIIPIQFSYAQQKGQVIDEQIITIMREIASEKNAIIEAFNRLKTVSHTALDSQALIQLKKEYCDKHQCLKCAIGNSILKK